MLCVKVMKILFMVFLVFLKDYLLEIAIIKDYRILCCHFWCPCVYESLSFDVVSLLLGPIARKTVVTKLSTPLFCNCSSRQLYFRPVSVDEKPLISFKSP